MHSTAPALTLSPRTLSTGELDAWLTAHLRHWQLDALAPALRTVARELADNALRHGATPARATLTRLPSARLRLAVTDAGPGFDPTTPGPGLRRVAARTTAWGVDPLPLGHRVWADLTLA
ncbi:ATP-binding protein [Kitasatospora sp. NPDC088134]|uniref:ATP-binding protein n=1 Tax=Kitasatospora sp. NPDC088134 TaxID=3364071 RepID=UPI00380A5C5A